MTRLLSTRILGVSIESQYMIYSEYTLWFYDIICAHARNYTDREVKEASLFKFDLVAVQLYLGLYWSIYLPNPHICRSGVRERAIKDAGTENR